ncbi:MAG: A/G-specific adenine glycosylase [Planctomycetes bacterium]|nr:A/G-specific adenine glycosylase [Planctomycetota bacterium]
MEIPLACDDAAFLAPLLAWFRQAMRPLPWRQTYDPYSVWISEIMLQQTQMSRGVQYFENWLRRFPDIRSVAEADEAAILSAWEGLGYYSRAKNLHRAAQRIMTEHGGVFPEDPAAIRALPGVGAYTAGAIAAIAFNRPEPAVDANVLRIFSRLGDVDAPVTDPAFRAAVTALAARLSAQGPPRLICQAFMELGALVCGKRPACDGCPVASVCLARQRGTVAHRPRKGAPTAFRNLVMAAAVVIRNHRLFIRRRPATGLWAGFWEMPAGLVAAEETPESAALRVLREAGLTARSLEPLATVRHGFTTNRVVLHGFRCRVDSPPAPGDDTAWIIRETAAATAFPAGQRKLLEVMGWKRRDGRQEKRGKTALEE